MGIHISTEEGGAIVDISQISADVLSINLRNKQLTFLPVQIANFSNARTMNLSGNKVTTIPSKLANVVTLTEWIQSYNQLSKIPAGIHRLANLTDLDLSHNMISTLTYPKFFTRLLSLTVFNLSFNQLETLPPNLSQLYSLNSLNASHNKLTTIETPIGHLGMLSQLNLSFNQLEQLPDDLFEPLSPDPEQITGKSGKSDSVTSRKGMSLAEALLASDTGSTDSLQLLNPPPKPTDENESDDEEFELYSATAASKVLASTSPILINLKLNNNKLHSLPTSVSYLERLTNLDLSNNMIRFIPECITDLEKLEVLNLAGNYIDRLPFSIRKLKSLIVLDVRVNQLTELPPALDKLQNLEKFLIDYNLLTCLESFSSQQTTSPAESTASSSDFAPATVLSLLNATGNEIADADPLLSNYSNIQDLNLSENKLTCINANFYHLVRLNLSQNQMTELTPSIQHCPIKYLDLSYNKFTSSILDSVKNISTLLSARFDFNLIKTIPNDFFNLMPSLVYVDFRHNSITSIPDSIGNATSLERLVIASNSLSSLPSTISKCDKLSKLNISFQHFPNSIINHILKDITSYCPTLTRLYAASCSIRTIPKDLSKFKRLFHLDLSSNFIQHVPSEISNLASLSRLEISDNYIDKMPDISSMNNLKHLDLNSNSLVEVPLVPVAINEIHLGHNNLENLSSKFLSQIQSGGELEHFDISYNRIKSIPNEFFDFGYGLKHFNVEGNPFLTDSLPTTKLLSLMSLSKLSCDRKDQFTRGYLREINHPEAMRASMNSSPNPQASASNSVRQVTLVGGKRPKSHVTDPSMYSKLVALESFVDVVSPSSRFEVGYSEAKGFIRSQMEDAFVLLGNVLKDHDIFGVLDGHGGPQASSWASHFIASKIRQYLLDFIPTPGIQRKTSSFRKLRDNSRFPSGAADDFNISSDLYAGSSGEISGITKGETVFVKQHSTTSNSNDETRGGKSFEVFGSNQPKSTLVHKPLISLSPDNTGNDDDDDTSSEPIKNNNDASLLDPSFSEHTSVESSSSSASSTPSSSPRTVTSADAEIVALTASVKVKLEIKTPTTISESTKPKKSYINAFHEPGDDPRGHQKSASSSHIDLSSLSFDDVNVTEETTTDNDPTNLSNPSPKVTTKKKVKSKKNKPRSKSVIDNLFDRKSAEPGNNNISGGQSLTHSNSAGSSIISKTSKRVRTFSSKLFKGSKSIQRPLSPATSSKRFHLSLGKSPRSSTSSSPGDPFNSKSGNQSLTLIPSAAHSTPPGLVSIFPNRQNPSNNLNPLKNKTVELHVIWVNLLKEANKAMKQGLRGQLLLSEHHQERGLTIRPVRNNLLSTSVAPADDESTLRGWRIATQEDDTTVQIAWVEVPSPAPPPPPPPSNDWKAGKIETNLNDLVVGTGRLADSEDEDETQGETGSSSLESDTPSQDDNDSDEPTITPTPTRVRTRGGRGRGGAGIPPRPNFSAISASGTSDDSASADTSDPVHFRGRNRGRSITDSSTPPRPSAALLAAAAATSSATPAISETEISSLEAENRLLHVNTIEKGTLPGSTLCLTHITPSLDFYCINIGDSRCVLGRSDGTAIRISKDHKPTNRDEYLRIKQLGGYITELKNTWRVQGSLGVSRALGDYMLQPFVTYKPEIFHRSLDLNVNNSSFDNFLIIACDGLWDVCSDETACSIVLKAFNSGEPAHRSANRLRNYALTLNSTDNISIVVTYLVSRKP